MINGVWNSLFTLQVFSHLLLRWLTMTSVYVGDKKFNKHFDTLSSSGRDDEAAEKKENFIFGVESEKRATASRWQCEKSIRLLARIFLLLYFPLNNAKQKKQRGEKSIQ